MEKIYDILNIKNYNIELEIMNAIKTTKEILNGLTTTRTCKIYSATLSNVLKKKNIFHRLIDTETKDMNYSHQFVMVPINGNSAYIIDLTFEQFGYNYLYYNMYNKGYMKMNDEEFNSYLDYIEFNNLEIDDYINNTRK